MLAWCSLTFEWGKTLGGALFTSANGIVHVIITAQATLENVFADINWRSRIRCVWRAILLSGRMSSPPSKKSR